VYPEPLDSQLNTLASSADVDRLGLDLHVSVGYSVSPNSYVVAGVYGVADRLQDSFGDFIQVNTYLYGPGFRFYPFDTGLVLGADLGAARLVLQTSVTNSAVSPWGVGWRGSVGYDFDSTPTGFAVLLGLGVGSAAIDGDTVGHAEVFLSLLWK
jgi:hypothetical protein